MSQQPSSSTYEVFESFIDGEIIQMKKCDLTTTVIPWPFQHMSVKYLINFEIFISTNGIFLNIHNYPLQYFFDLEEIIFKNFNISEISIISVELAKN